MSKSALIIVDLQPDFMPGGPLAVPKGDTLVEQVNQIMHRFDVVVATQDWHPPGHASFASARECKPFDVLTDHNGNQQVLWPDHCVQGTPGAALHPDLNLNRVDLILRKGMGLYTDSYSAFIENYNPLGIRKLTGLDGYLHAKEVSEVYVCGLALDYCVKWTAVDASRLGFKTKVIEDLALPVDPANLVPTFEEFQLERVTTTLSIIV